MQSHTTRHGFSLIELLVVLSVTVILTSLLFPAFRGVRESAQRLACSSNMRQIGLALTMYSDQNNNLLPFSRFSNVKSVQGGAVGPRELNSASLGEYASYFGIAPGVNSWAGLGWLLETSPGGGFLDNATVLYSPSYRGTHTFEKYESEYSSNFGPVQRLVTNYHYCGHTHFDRAEPRKLLHGHEQILLTGGLSAVREMNQADGTNVLHGDCVVSWYKDDDRKLRTIITEEIELKAPSAHPNAYLDIWALLMSGK